MPPGNIGSGVSPESDRYDVGRAGRVGGTVTNHSSTPPGDAHRKRLVPWALSGSLEAVHCQLPREKRRKGDRRLKERTGLMGKN